MVASDGANVARVGSIPIIRSKLLYDGGMPWLKPNQRERQVIFLATSGTEYLVTLFSIGIAEADVPPDAVFETDDGWVEASDGRRWKSLHDMAVAHGFIVGDFSSDDPDDSGN